MEEFGNALDFINHDVFYTRTPLDKRTQKLRIRLHLATLRDIQKRDCESIRESVFDPDGFSSSTGSKEKKNFPLLG